MPIPKSLGAVLLVSQALAGCSLFETAPEFPPVCPTLSLLGDAADVTRFRGGGRDITDLVLDGRITAVPAQCTRGGRGIIKATVQVKASLARGAAATGREAAVGYVISVLEGETILDQQDYRLVGQFPPNVDRVDLTSPPVELRLPVSAQKNASAYKIYVGFRLTADELDYNRKRGPR